MDEPTKPLTTPIDLLWMYGVIPAGIGAVIALICEGWNRFDWEELTTVFVAAAVVLGVGIALCHALLINAKPPKNEAKLIGDPLHTIRLSTGVRQLTQDLVIEANGRRITVPADEKTDFSSIPFFGRFVVRWSQVDVAGVVHDWLYRTGEVSRREADSLWYLCARSGRSRANPLQAWVCWASLRVGGGYAWREARKEKKPKPADPQI